MQRLDFLAMGCQMLALIESTEAEATELLTQVPTWFEEWEQSLSRFRDDSELIALNRAEGKPMRVSETLWQVLESAMRAAVDSNGIVTPTLLDAILAAGYDCDFASLEPSVARTNINLPLTRNSWLDIELDENNRTVRMPHEMHLDFGGVAKGWAADHAAQRLNQIAPALVDAGGDLALSTAKRNGDAWPIAVADPFKPETDLALLIVHQGGVATSGRDYRRWERNGKWQHHIIDPRTRAPAETNVLSATVIAPTAERAEVAAKVALILGSGAGLEWIDARNDLAALLVLENGHVLHSRRLDEYLWCESDDRIVLANPVTAIGFAPKAHFADRNSELNNVNKNFKIQRT